MIATTDNKINNQPLYVYNTKNVDLGLVKRGTDLALSNDVENTRVTINDKETVYPYDSENSLVTVDLRSSRNVSYNLAIRRSDYNYRIRDYFNSQNFTQREYTDNTSDNGNQSGDELKVYVTYKVHVVNQSPNKTTVNELKYYYDSRYTLNQDETNKLNNLNLVNNVDNHTLTITLDKNVEGLTAADVYLVFNLPKENIEDEAVCYNTVEITKYSTENGLIDIDSEPGDYPQYFEDDTDEAGGITIDIVEDKDRVIAGYVFEDANKAGKLTDDKINDVIVQLVEFKTMNGKNLEYIWQETVSGSGSLKRLSDDGQAIENITYEKKDGYYEFRKHIPGDYIVRFIYGDGTTYDVTPNVIKYNGQDYQSTKNLNYNKLQYVSTDFTETSSVVRDNEARRLETMAYTANVDLDKGILLKLLDGQTMDKFNVTEQKELQVKHNVTTDDGLKALLKNQTLANTWMCAETSNIDVGVENNLVLPYMHCGLTKRPEASIELHKLITGMNIVASNGQVIASAKLNVDAYFQNEKTLHELMEGKTDNIQATREFWHYEVDQTMINTVVEGATLEYEYTVVAINRGDPNYLSKALMNEYNNKGIEDYISYLAARAAETKLNLRAKTHNTGTYLGAYYYTGNDQVSDKAEVRVQLTNIRDYVRNEVELSQDVSEKLNKLTGIKHNKLNDNGTIEVDGVTLDTVLNTKNPTSKMATGTRENIFTVPLKAKKALSVSGTLNYKNYAAEVMSYTEASGRRMKDSTPANIEAVDSSQEPDETETPQVAITPATGHDEKAQYIWLITIIAGVIVIAVGTFTTKKYIIKK